MSDQTFAVFDTPFSKKTLAELESRRATIVRFPSIETVRSDNLPSENDLTGFLSRFDWLIFEDILAAEHFIEMLNEAEFDLFELDAVRICALGEAVADRLRFVQVHADLIPPNNRPETILRQFEDYLAGDVKSQKVLIVKSEASKNLLTACLTEAGCQTHELKIYRLNSAKTSELTKLRAFLLGGAIDFFVFTNPADLDAFTNLFPSENPPQLLADTKILAADPLTFQYLSEHNFKPALFR